MKPPRRILSYRRPSAPRFTARGILRRTAIASAVLVGAIVAGALLGFLAYQIIRPRVG